MICFPNFFVCSQFRKILICVLLADVVLAYVVDRLCSVIFGEVRYNIIV
jgi:hypothetical protein